MSVTGLSGFIVRVIMVGFFFFHGKKVSVSSDRVNFCFYVGETRWHTSLAIELLNVVV